MDKILLIELTAEWARDRHRPSFLAEPTGPPRLHGRFASREPVSVPSKLTVTWANGMESVFAVEGCLLADRIAVYDFQTTWPAGLLDWETLIRSACAEVVPELCAHGRLARGWELEAQPVR